MKRILIVRHGATEWTEAARLQGHTDVDLSEHGVMQAQRLMPIIRELSPDLAIVSDLMRARRTAELLGFPNAERTAALREMHLGSWTGETVPEILVREPENYLAWRHGTFDPPGGERWVDMCRRAETVVREKLVHAERLFVVCHDVIIRALLRTLVGLHPRQITSTRPASLTIVKIRNEEEVALEIFNYHPDGAKVATPFQRRL